LGKKRKERRIEQAHTTIYRPEDGQFLPRKQCASSKKRGKGEGEQRRAGKRMGTLHQKGVIFPLSTMIVHRWEKKNF